MIRLQKAEGYIVVTRWEEGSLMGRATLKDQEIIPQSAFRRAAGELGVDCLMLIPLVEQFVVDGADCREIKEENSSPPFSCSVGGVSFSDVLASLSHPQPCSSPVRWVGKEEWCVLDVDFHGGGTPTERDIRDAGLALRPTPVANWRSKSGGMHAIYRAHGGYTAEELACVGMLWLKEDARVCGATYELKADTFLPPKEWHRREPDADIGAVRRLLSRYTQEDSEVQEYLDSHGFAVGQRYPHTLCPVNPIEGAKANSDPVTVHEDHIFCYLCAAHGTTRGSLTPGYFRYATLCGRRFGTQLDTCVKHFTHWEHAERVFACLVKDLPPTHTEIIYRVALKDRHPNDPRIPEVFRAGNNLIRYEGYWGDRDGKARRWPSSGLPAKLCELPAARSSDNKIVPVKVEDLLQPGDITHLGYPPITPVFGIQVSRNFASDSLLSVVHHPALRAASEAWRRPLYLDQKSRGILSVLEAREVIESVLPGVNWPLVELLIVCKGIVESGDGRPPMLFLSGPTGAGKTSSVLLAASICGDSVSSVPICPDTQRVKAALFEGKRQGSFITFDEVLKGAADSKKDAVTVLEMLLNFTPYALNHVLYVGPVAMGRLPVCIWADTELPVTVAEHSQLARRLAHVRLPSRKHWDANLNRIGAHTPGELRVKGDKDIVRAMNVILSDLIDRKFPLGGSTPLFQEEVRAHGFRMLEDQGKSEDRDQAIRRLFDLVCIAPPLSGPDLKRWGTDGWKVIDLNTDCELTDTWLVLADKKDLSRTRVADVDLQELIGLKYPAQIEVKKHGRRVVVRFVGGGVYNEDLKC